MDLTIAEKRDLLERIKTLIEYDVLKKEDRDKIYIICLAACGRALGERRETQ